MAQEERKEEPNGEAKINNTPEPETPISMGPKFLGDPIWLEITEEPNGEPVFLSDGKLHINKESLENENRSVQETLSGAIESGNEELFNKLTGGLEESEDEDLLRLHKELRDAFDARTKNPFELSAINVDLLTKGIAERNLIREGLKPQIAKQPFTFKDKNGDSLDIEKDIDFVFVNDGNGSYKIIVASKKGIEEIQIPKELGEDKFQPDFTNIDRDNVNDSIIIPLKASRDGLEPLANAFEIRKGAIDLIAAVKRQEKQEEENNRVARERQQQTYSTPPYNPPAPQAPRRSSEGGGSRYVSGSR